jgi:hypothetical protein
VDDLVRIGRDSNLLAPANQLDDYVGAGVGFPSTRRSLNEEIGIGEASDSLSGCREYVIAAGNRLSVVAGVDSG